MLGHSAITYLPLYTSVAATECKFKLQMLLLPFANIAYTLKMLLSLYVNITVSISKCHCHYELMLLSRCKCCCYSVLGMGDIGILECDYCKAKYHDYHDY